MSRFWSNWAQKTIPSRERCAGFFFYELLESGELVRLVENAPKTGLCGGGEWAPYKSSHDGRKFIAMDAEGPTQVPWNLLRGQWAGAVEAT